MSEILSGIDRVVCMMDDVLVHGATKEEHDLRVQAVVHRLQEAGVTLNQEKCKFFQKSMKILGHVVDQSGIRPDPNKVIAIQQVKTPRNVGDVRRFLGMVNQLSKFSHNLAEETKPLRELLVKSNAWLWDKPQQTAFDMIKMILVNAPVLALLNPNLPLCRCILIQARGSATAEAALWRVKACCLYLSIDDTH